MDKTESKVEFVTTYAPAFRRHYQIHYHDRGYSYEEYEPAYCLGYELVAIHGQGNRTWDDVEGKARRRWKRQGEALSWEEVRGAVEHGWNEAREGIGLQDVDEYDEDFYAHFQARYGATGHAYDDYEPAYRYGTDLAYDERYMRRLWPELEPEIREIWERRGDTPWNSVKDAIEYAWNRARSPLEQAYDPLVTYDEDTFQAHHTGTDSSGRPYEYYEPAYRFGYDLAYKRRYRGKPWEEVEPQVEREWARSGNDTPWQEVKGAVHHAWREVQKALTLQER
jgi:hypothetical protein